MSDELIFVENDTLMFLSNLTDKDGNSITDATVTVTLFKAGGGQVGGQSWPLNLPYVSASSQYEAVLDKAVNVVNNKGYRAKFIVTSGTSDGVFWKNLVGKERVV